MQLHLDKERLPLPTQTPVSRIVGLFRFPLKVVVGLRDRYLRILRQLLGTLEECFPRHIIDVITRLMKKLAYQRSILIEPNDMPRNT